MLEEFKQELQCFVDEGILIPCGATGWATLLFAVAKKMAVHGL
jgi:hypothetical protein